MKKTEINAPKGVSISIGNFAKKAIGNHLLVTIIVVGLLWSVSSNLYYTLVKYMNVKSGYDEAPLTFAAYYLLWSVAALILFRRVLADRLKPDVLRADVIGIVPSLLLFSLFAVVILPRLPEISLWRAPQNPPEFMFASGWYYLPKAFDIFFQQILVAALVWAAARQNYSLISIAIGTALLFGGFHLLLALDGFTSFYVMRFTVAATLFGAVVPYIYLRMKAGFPVAYGLHWAFYAGDAVFTHIVLSA